VHRGEDAAVSDTIIVALLVSIISPTIVGVMTAWTSSRSRKQDWASLLAAAQKESIERTDEVARLAAERDTRMAEQLKDIHTLVNSDMTAARQSELDQTRLVLTMTEKVIALDEAAGRAASASDLEAVATAKDRVEELRVMLADRLAAQDKVERDQAL
jgi:hypothetical protein